MSERILTISDANITTVAKSLANGDVCVFPTDTLYAVSAACNNDKAIEKLIEIKKRPSNRTLPILVSSIEMAEQYVVFSDIARDLASKYWPGTLTLVLPATEDADISKYCIENGFIAVRIPNSNSAISVISQLGHAVVGTSANVSGQNNISNVLDIEANLSKDIAYILHDSTQQISLNASTIVKIVENELTILRQGDLFITPQNPK